MRYLYQVELIQINGLKPIGPFLEQFEEIILWFDNDEAGLKGVREASSRLTNNIVKIVKCTIANDINELLAKEGKQSVLDHIKKLLYL